MFAHQSVTAYHCGLCQRTVQYRPEISTILNVPIGHTCVRRRKDTDKH
jgi:hypothetical protein